MPYAQTEYQEKVGNGPYTIAQIGCFLTAFCNLAEAFNITVTPPQLNDLFIEYSDYLADPEDGAGVRDDLSWNSITSAESSIVVASEGTEGWPQSNNSIVKFYYPDPKNNNAMTTHFCKVSDFNSQLILDSWDGKIKEVGEYGQPVAWATYSSPVVQAVETAVNPPAPAAPATPMYEVIKTIPGYGDANNAANHINPVNNVEAGSYFIFNEADGMTNVTAKEGEAGAWINPADNVADVEPAVPEVPAPTPPTAVKPANTSYTKLGTPLDLVTNKQPTNKWALDFVNDTEATSVEELPEGMPFLAYGKAQRTDGDKPAYFMTFADFGDADTTGVPTNNNGVNTVDLSPAPVSTAAKPAITTNEDGSENIPVTVASWQSSFKAFLSPQEYVANATLTIQDINEDGDGDDLFPTTLIKGQTVMVGGMFSRDGFKYYRTQNSVKSGWWYGIPVISLTKVGAVDEEQDTELGNLLDDIDMDDKAIVSKVDNSSLFKKLFNKK